MKRTFFLMKRTLLPLLFLLIFATVLEASPVSREKASRAAVNWMLIHAGCASADAIVTSTHDLDHEGVVFAWVFNFNGGGFAIVSADDVAVPVIVYSCTGSYGSAPAPPAFSELMSTAGAEILAAVADGLEASRETSSLWNELLDGENGGGSGGTLKKGGGMGTMSVSPLLSTTWHQTWPYNKYCPSTSAGGSGGHVYAGCVATTMAQIMKYYSSPTTGVGSHSYTHSTYGTQSANFGNTTYQYSSMPNALTTSSSQTAQNTIATLIYHCGVSVDMNYGTSGSGASTANARLALINYFRFSSTASMVYRSSYSASQWINLCTTELNAARPIMFRGSAYNGLGGHAFILDGYTGTDYFHTNFGWGGYLDGYYYLNNLTPSNYNFNHYQGMIVGLEPQQALPPSLLSPPDNATGVCVSPMLTWIPVAGATSYAIQVASNATFSNLLVDQSGLATTSYSAPGLSQNSTYYWRANSAGGAGTSPWSAIRSFTTLDATLGASGPVSFCDGGSVTLSTSFVSGATYSWQHNGIPIIGAYSPTCIASMDGDYTVAITVTNCVTNSNTLHVTVYDWPQAEIFLNGSAEICEGSVVTLSATAGSGYTYQWFKDGVSMPSQTGINCIVTESGSYAVQISNHGCITGSSPQQVNVHPLDPTDLTWTGAIDDSWYTIGNWDTPCAIPSANDNVTIPDGAAPPASMPMITLQDLTLDNPEGLKLSGNTIINGSLQLDHGKLMLGDFELRLAAGASVTGAGASKYIVTDGSGQFLRENIGTGGSTGSVLFPVGADTLSYTPLLLENSAAAKEFSVRVVNHVLDGGYVGTPLTDHIVDKTWILGEGQTGGTDLTLTFEWTASDELSGFDRGTAIIARNENGAGWNALQAPGSSQGNDPYTRTVSGVTMISALGSPFAIGDASSAIPVEMISFSAAPAANGILLSWRTVLEENNAGFDVQRRQTSEWTSLGFVSACATPGGCEYDFLDEQAPTGNIAYRLRQLDMDGSVSYSRSIEVFNETLPSTLRISALYPNPLQLSRHGSVILEFKSDMNDAVDVAVYDALGRLVSKLRTSGVAGVSSVRVNTTSLAPGTYLLRLSQQTNVTQQVFTVLR